MDSFTARSPEDRTDALAAGSRPLVHFTEQAGRIHLRSVPAARLAVTELPSALVTTLQPYSTVVDSAGVSNRKGWTAAFWRVDPAVRSAIDLLCEGFTSPVLWLMGEYNYRECCRLEREGYLDFAPTCSPKSNLELVSIIVRATPHSLPPLPSEQGFGHFAGVKIVIFAEDEEPAGLLEQWKSEPRSAESALLSELVGKDGGVPAPALAALLPFGTEARDHAVIAKRDVPPEQLARELARRLETEYLECHCSEIDFWLWEGEDIPPPDLAAILLAPARPPR